MKIIKEHFCSKNHYDVVIGELKEERSDNVVKSKGWSSIDFRERNPKIKIISKCPFCNAELKVS